MIRIFTVLLSSEYLHTELHSQKVKFIGGIFFFFYFALTNLVLLSTPVMATHYTACHAFSHSNHEPPVQSHFDGQKSRNLNVRFDNNLKCQKRKQCIHTHIYMYTHLYVHRTVEFYRDIRENFTGFDVPIDAVYNRVEPGNSKTEGGADTVFFFSILPISKKSTLSFSTLSHGVSVASRSCALFFATHNVYNINNMCNEIICV